MKKQLFTALALGLLATTLAYAQSIPLKANVPFNFVVTGGTLPGGEYAIQSQRMDPERQFTITGIGQAPKVFLAVPCLNLKGGGISKQTKLVFNHYGDQYFLSEIWVKGKGVGQKLPRTRREVEMAKNSALQQAVVLAEER